MRNLIKSKSLFILSVLIFVYVFFAFLAPILMKYGYPNIAEPIYKTYELFCHQRVERSLFIFGEKSFYTLTELKDFQFLPEKSESDEYPEYFGQGFNGNSEVGYKVAICVRDIALYLSFAFTLLFLSFRNLKEYNIALIVILVSPIFLDIGIQIVFEILRLEGIYLDYINGIFKRFLTGGLAGIGVAFGLSNIIVKSLTNDSKKGDNQE